MPYKCFVSYAHADEELFTNFVEKLKEYASESKYLDLNLWDDRQILIGTDWHKDIQNQKEECDFAFLLVSDNFINSKYIIEYEINEIGNDEFLFIPILLSPVDFEDRKFKSLRAYQFFNPKIGNNTGIVDFKAIKEVEKKYFEELVKAIDERLESDSFKASMDIKKALKFHGINAWSEVFKILDKYYERKGKYSALVESTKEKSFKTDDDFREKVKSFIDDIKHIKKK